MSKPCMAVLNSFMKLYAYQEGVCRNVLEKRQEANAIRSTSLCASQEEEELCAKVFYPYKKLMQEMRCMCRIQADYMYSYGQRNKETDVCTQGFEEIPDIHYLEHCFNKPRPQFGFHLFHKPDFTCTDTSMRFYTFENRFSTSREWLKDDLYDQICYAYSDEAKSSLPPIGDDCENVPVPYHPLTCKETTKNTVCDSIDTNMYCQYSCSGCSVAPMPYDLAFCNMTVHDCECVEGDWLYDIDNDGEPEVYNGCAKTMDEDRGYWCPIGHPGTCTDPEKTKYRTYEFCYPETCARKPAVEREVAKLNYTDVEICATSRNLCECEAKWQFDVNLDGENETYSGCAYVPQVTGAWCKYNTTETCRNPERVYYEDLELDYCYKVKNCSHLQSEVEMESFKRFPTFRMEGKPCTPPCLEGAYPNSCKLLDDQIKKLQTTDFFCKEISSEEIEPFQESKFECPTYGVCQIRTETLVKRKMRNGCYCYKPMPKTSGICDSITGAAELAMNAWNVTQEFCDDREMNVPIVEYVPEPEPAPVPEVVKPAKKPTKPKTVKKEKAQKDKDPLDLDDLVNKLTPEEVTEDEDQDDQVERIQQLLEQQDTVMPVNSGAQISLYFSVPILVLGTYYFLMI
eukprot:TRINITY_DN4358_c2_g2_i1.p1 TRINITY_DN4358_c2_g2~~TRINITY_DN4358_c2_g2_i1.p1  ORF type:complete len:713 (+),score=69.84 TRINITY_DN4358_c2_g2_i1:263-2140(+)